MTGAATDGSDPGDWVRSGGRLPADLGGGRLPAEGWHRSLPKVSSGGPPVGADRMDRVGTNGRLPVESNRHGRAGMGLGPAAEMIGTDEWAELGSGSKWSREEPKTFPEEPRTFHEEHRPERARSKERSLPMGVKLGSYDGTTSLEAFLARFESWSEYCGWNERDQVFQLKQSLVGPAGNILWSEKGRRATAAQIKDLLKCRFGHQHQEGEVYCRTAGSQEKTGRVATVAIRRPTETYGFGLLYRAHLVNGFNRKGRFCERAQR